MTCGALVAICLVVPAHAVLCPPQSDVCAYNPHSEGRVVALFSWPMTREQIRQGGLTPVRIHRR